MYSEEQIKEQQFKIMDFLYKNGFYAELFGVTSDEEKTVLKINDCVQVDCYGSSKMNVLFVHHTNIADFEMPKSKEPIMKIFSYGGVTDFPLMKIKKLEIGFGFKDIQLNENEICEFGELDVKDSIEL